MDKETFIPVRTHLLHAAGDNFIVYDYFSEKTHLLHGLLASALKKLTRFASLEDHAGDIFAGGWAFDSDSMAIDALRQLVEQGLLVSKSDIIDRNRWFSKGEAAEPIAVMAWPTAGRTVLVGRGMESFIKHNRKHNRTVHYRVINDSRDRSLENDMMNLLISLRERTSAEISYAGITEKQEFAAGVSDAGAVPRDVVDFALFDPCGCGLTYGANRNALLLACAGSLALSVDDDMVCVPAIPGETARGLELADMMEPRDFYFYEKRADTLQGVHTVDEGILAAHEKLLGRHLADCIAGIVDPGGIVLNINTFPLLEDLGKGIGRVRATAGGSYGDSGMGSPRALLVLRDETRARLVVSEKTYRSALTGREMMQCMSRSTVSTGPFFPGMNIGLDGRELLPPFFPVMRGEDYIFAYTLRACFRDGLIGYPPVALAHFPEGVRRFPPGELHAMDLFLSEIVYLIVQSYKPGPGLREPEERMRALGGYFTEIAAIAASDFEAFLKVRWLAQASFKISYLEDLLRTYNENPAFWARDLKDHIAAIEHFALHGQVTVPRDLLPGRTPEEARVLGQKLIGRFGELLRWWPVIWNAARRMNEEGRGLARPLCV